MGPLTIRLAKLIRELKRRVGPIRNLRDKVLAHSDLPTALQAASLLPPVTRGLVDELLFGMEGVLNEIEVEIHATRTEYGLIGVDGDGDDLVFDLEQAEVHRHCGKRIMEAKHGIRLP